MRLNNRTTASCLTLTPTDTFNSVNLQRPDRPDAALFVSFILSAFNRVVDSCGAVPRLDFSYSDSQGVFEFRELKFSRSSHTWSCRGPRVLVVRTEQETVSDFPRCGSRRKAVVNKLATSPEKNSYGAIGMAHRRLVMCWCMLVCLLLACQQVLGIELRHSKEDETLDTSYNPVDEKNLYRTEDGTVIELFPEPEAHLQFGNSTRRKLGEFLGCAFCKCCDAAKTFCKAGLPCCYSINCNVQPFGFCKFVPIACNCKECGI